MTALKNYQAFIFDMDGTIVDSLEDLADAVNHVLAAHQLPVHSYEEFHDFIGHGSVYLIQAALGPAHQDIFSCIFQEYYDYYFTHCCLKTHPFPGLKESLDVAKTHGILLFVDTNKPNNIAQYVADTCFGTDYFTKIVGVPLGRKVKPNPEVFTESVKSYGLDYQRCVYFGDSTTDILTAKNLDVADMFACAWGYQDRKHLSQFRPTPTKILDDPCQIRELLAE